MFELRRRAVTTWILLAALWLQAFLLPVQLVRAEAVDALPGFPGFHLCSTGAADQHQLPAAPSPGHHQHDCCLTGRCGVPLAFAVSAPVPWRLPVTAAALPDDHPTDAAPRAPPTTARPYTTGPPLLS